MCLHSPLICNMAALAELLHVWTKNSTCRFSKETVIWWTNEERREHLSRVLKAIWKWTVKFSYRRRSFSSAAYWIACRRWANHFGTKAVFNLCVEAQLFCDLVHRDLALGKQNCGVGDYRCAPVAEKSLFLHCIWWTITKTKGREGIVRAELWFHLARLGSPGGSGYSLLLLLSQTAE